MNILVYVPLIDDFRVLMKKVICFVIVISSRAKIMVIPIRVCSDKIGRRRPMRKGPTSSMLKTFTCSALVRYVSLMFYQVCKV